jgi:hypothetical protein
MLHYDHRSRQDHKALIFFEEVPPEVKGPSSLLLRNRRYILGLMFKCNDTLMQKRFQIL